MDTRYRSTVTIPRCRRRLFAGTGRGLISTSSISTARSRGVRSTPPQWRRSSPHFRASVQLGGGIRDARRDRPLAGTGRRPGGDRHRRAGGSGAGARSRARTICPGRIVVGVDAREGLVATRGWADVSDVPDGRPRPALRRCRRRLALLFTDVGRDGHAQGLQHRRDAARWRAQTQIPVIASGGVASLERHRLTLEGRTAPTGIEGVITGRALYDGRMRSRRRAEGRGQAVTVRVPASSPASTSRAGAWSKESTSSTWPMPATRSSRRGYMMLAHADELCFLDITASHEGRGTILDVVARTAAVCFMPLTVGGGVRSVEDARALPTGGRRQGRGQFRRGRATRARRASSPSASAASASSARSTRARVAPGRWEVFTHGGRQPDRRSTRWRSCPIRLAVARRGRAAA